MDRDELTAWALSNGWQVVGGHPSLARPSKPKEAIVRLVLKVTVVALEIKKPSGKWDKVASAAYAQVKPDPEGGPPSGLGLENLPGLSMLIRDNKDMQVFAGVGKSR
jgi:hypothetical protein